MTTLDELFMRSRRRTGARPADDAPFFTADFSSFGRTGARPADDAPKRTGDGARAHGDGSTDGTDAPQRPGGPTMAPTPRPARSAATIAEARSAATDATPNAPTPRPADDAPATTWRIRYIDGTERVIAFSPAKTREEVLHAETGAVEAAAYVPGKTPPERPLLEDERTRIRRWLELIGETDPATIARVLAAAAEDSTARHYYLERFRDWEERAAVTC